MRIKLRASLELIRLPNLFTAMADVLAGYLIVRGGSINWGELFAVMIASAGFYGGGCALNDLHDHERDAALRPQRPLASGRLTRGEAGFITAGLFVLGTICTAVVGATTLFLGLVLLLLIVLYDLFAKEWKVIGSINMAACRSVNLLLGMSVSSLFSDNALYFVLPAVTFGYVLYLTLLSQFEEQEGQGAPSSLFFTCGIVVFSLVLLVFLVSFKFWSGLPFLILFQLYVIPPLLKALSRKSRASTGQAVKHLILGIVLLDAFYVASIQGIWLGVPILLCLVAAFIFARLFYVT